MYYLVKLWIPFIKEIKNEEAMVESQKVPALLTK